MIGSRDWGLGPKNKELGYLIQTKDFAIRIKNQGLQTMDYITWGKGEDTRNLG